jgi:hypothetical protein
MVFLETYGISDEFNEFEMRPQFVLVYGRRAEFERRPQMRSVRALQQGADEYHVTFDRLRPDYNAGNYLALRKHGAQVSALVVPPTVRLGPAMSGSWLPVVGRPEAALRQLRMSPERRRFVAGRFAYWDEWARRGGRSYRVGDWE